MANGAAVVSIEQGKDLALHTLWGRRTSCSSKLFIVDRDLQTICTDARDVVCLSTQTAWLSLCSGQSTQKHTSVLSHALASRREPRCSNQQRQREQHPDAPVPVESTGQLDAVYR
jgi:hypothetical protein